MTFINCDYYKTGADKRKRGVSNEKRKGIKR